MKLKKFSYGGKRKSLFFITIISIVLILSVIYLFQSFAYYEENKSFDVINGTVANPGDLYFAFYVDDVISKNMPSIDSGYLLNEEKSSCTNDVTISWNQQDWIANLDFSSYKKSDNSRVKCTLYFSNIKYDETTLYDLSGNHYDGTFQNGAKVISDTEGKKAIYFDGIDDFVKIKEIPNIFEWNKGITVEFEATWYAFNSWSRIFDFSHDNSTNNDVVFVSNQDAINTLVLGGRTGGVYIATNSDFSDSIEQNIREKIKMTRTKINDSSNECQTILEKNGLLDSRTFTTLCVTNINYKDNYLGKSVWEYDGYFNGLIYNLKIIDANGKIIIWYDVN